MIKMKAALLFTAFAAMLSLVKGSCITDTWDKLMEEDFDVIKGTIDNDLVYDGCRKALPEDIFKPSDLKTNKIQKENVVRHIWRVLSAKRFMSVPPDRFEEISCGLFKGAHFKNPAVMTVPVKYNIAESLPEGVAAILPWKCLNNEYILTANATTLQRFEKALEEVPNIGDILKYKGVQESISLKAMELLLHGNGKWKAGDMEYLKDLNENAMEFIDDKFWEKYAGEELDEGLMREVVPRMPPSAFALVNDEIDSAVFQFMTDEQIASFDEEKKDLEEKCKLFKLEDLNVDAAAKIDPICFANALNEHRKNADEKDDDDDENDDKDEGDDKDNDAKLILPIGILTYEQNARIFRAVKEPNDVAKLDGKEVIGNATPSQLADLAAVYGAEADCVDEACGRVCAKFKESLAKPSKVEDAQFAHLPFACINGAKLLPSQLAFVGPALKKADPDLQWILGNETVLKHLTEHQFAIFLDGESLHDKCGDLELADLITIAKSNTGGALKAVDDFFSWVDRTKDKDKLFSEDMKDDLKTLIRSFGKWTCKRVTTFLPNEAYPALSADQLSHFDEKRYTSVCKSLKIQLIDPELAPAIDATCFKNAFDVFKRESSSEMLTLGEHMLKLGYNAGIFDKLVKDDIPHLNLKPIIAHGQPKQVEKIVLLLGSEKNDANTQALCERFKYHANVSGFSDAEIGKLPWACLYKATGFGGLGGAAIKAISGEALKNATDTTPGQAKEHLSWLLSQASIGAIEELQLETLLSGESGDPAHNCELIDVDIIPWNAYVLGFFSPECLMKMKGWNRVSGYAASSIVPNLVSGAFENAQQPFSRFVFMHMTEEQVESFDKETKDANHCKYMNLGALDQRSTKSTGLTANCFAGAVASASFLDLSAEFAEKANDDLFGEIKDVMLLKKFRRAALTTRTDPFWVGFKEQHVRAVLALLKKSSIDRSEFSDVIESLGEAFSALHKRKPTLDMLGELQSAWDEWPVNFYLNGQAVQRHGLLSSLDRSLNSPLSYMLVVKTPVARKQLSIAQFDKIFSENEYQLCDGVEAADLVGFRPEVLGKIDPRCIAQIAGWNPLSADVARRVIPYLSAEAFSLFQADLSDEAHHYLLQAHIEHYGEKLGGQQCIGLKLESLNFVHAGAVSPKCFSNAIASSGALKSGFYRRARADLFSQVVDVGALVETILFSGDDWAMLKLEHIASLLAIDQGTTCKSLKAAPIGLRLNLPPLSADCAVLIDPEELQNILFSNPESFAEDALRLLGADFDPAVSVVKFLAIRRPPLLKSFGAEARVGDHVCSQFDVKRLGDLGQAPKHLPAQCFKAMKNVDKLTLQEVAHMPDKFLESIDLRALIDRLDRSGFFARATEAAWTQIFKSAPVCAALTPEQFRKSTRKSVNAGCLSGLTFALTDAEVSALSSPTVAAASPETVGRLAKQLTLPQTAALGQNASGITSLADLRFPEGLTDKAIPALRPKSFSTLTELRKLPPALFGHISYEQLVEVAPRVLALTTQEQAAVIAKAKPAQGLRHPREAYTDAVRANMDPDVVAALAAEA